MAEESTSNDVGEAKRPKHSISFIISSECKGGSTDVPRDSLRPNRSGARSAFKEVHRRNHRRYSPLDSPASSLTILTERKRIPGGLPLQNYFPLLGGNDSGGERTRLESQTEASYDHASVLGGLMRSSGSLGLPYGALPFYPRIAGPGLFIRDPVALAAQNCCAKCGVQFRMTSDLVYHMRTHHNHKEVRGNGWRSPRQGTAAVPSKYRCVVCQESFKEKHHLSRHMTSHE